MKQLTDNNPVKQETITTQCIEIVQDIIRKETTVKTTDRLVIDLHADSLDILEIVMGLEEEFDIEISDEEVGELDTVLDYINFITSALKAK